jgi:ABC-2 type transport system ATP-binding protein
MNSALKIESLTKVYDNGFEALKGISLDVKQGDFFALLGPNGAGKSTTLGIVSSLVNKSSGSVSIFGHDLDTDLVNAKTCLGVVPQEFNFNQFEKVSDILITQAGYYGIPYKLAVQRAEKYLKKLGLWEKREIQSRELSGGMKRRLMIARALVHEPRLLILDEPTAGVDIELRKSMWTFLQEINKQGTTIILTTHYLEEAEALCRNIGIIDEGKILLNIGKRELLQQLNSESFILDLKDQINDLPEFGGFKVKKAEDNSIEVEVQKGTVLNDLFSLLSQKGIEVISMRSKANRLEELFLSIVDEGREQ